MIFNKNCPVKNDRALFFKSVSRMYEILRQRISDSFIRTMTVGFGISPNQPENGRADYTAGGEFHSALKQITLLLYYLTSGLSIPFL